VLLLDGEGKERARLEGYLFNNDFNAALRNGLGRIAFVHKRYSGSPVSAILPLTATTFTVPGLNPGTISRSSGLVLTGVQGSGSSTQSATAATNLAAAPAGYILSADGSGNVANSGTALSSLATVTDLSTAVSPLAPIANSSLTGTTTLQELVASVTSSPRSASTAGVTGQIAWDGSNFYVCTAGGVAGSAVWKATALSPI